MALHDAVTALRAGAVDGHAFQHVIMVGHSLGSVEAWIEAADYDDVDAVIITSTSSTRTSPRWPRPTSTRLSTTPSSPTPTWIRAT